MTKANGEAALRHLVGEIDRYLAGLAGADEEISAVRAGIAKHVAGPYRALTGQEPNCGSFDEALLLARAQGNGALVDAIVAAYPFLPWITYDFISPRGNRASLSESPHFRGPDRCTQLLRGQRFRSRTFPYRAAHALSRSSRIRPPNSTRRSPARIAGASASPILGNGFPPTSLSGTSLSASMRRLSGSIPSSPSMHGPAM